MRDKDSQLIFENYRKRVILNEALPALAIPAAGIGIAEVLGLAATVVGATALATEIAQKRDQIGKMFKLTPSTESVVEKVGSIIQANDTSVRGLEGALNYAKSLDVPVLNNLIQRNLNDLSMLKALQEGSLDLQQSVEYVKSILFTLKESSEELLAIAKRTTNEQLIRLLGEAGKRQDEQIRATQALANRLLDILSKEENTGGGKDPDKDPNKKNKILEILKAIYNNIATVKFWIATGILTTAVLILIGSVIGGKASGEAVTSGGIGVVNWFGDFAEGGMEALKPDKTKTPTNKWIPETPNLPKEKSNSSSEAAPTPIPFKRNKG
jgi:hypothetical protein